MSSKVDYSRFNTSELMGLKYTLDYESLPFQEKYFKDQTEFDYLENLFEEVQGKKPSVLPCVVCTKDSMFQDILPLRGYLTEENMVVMWGGYSNQSHWLTIPKDNYTLSFKKDGTCAKFEGIEIELVERKEAPTLVKAQKLSVLEIGDYKIQEAKAVTTSYGPTYIVVIENRGEYWANTQLKRFIDMLGTERLSLLPNMWLKVLDKTTTPQGNLSVKVGLHK